MYQVRNAQIENIHIFRFGQNTRSQVKTKEYANQTTTGYLESDYMDNN